MKSTLFVDGACFQNPGKGGMGFLLDLGTVSFFRAISCEEITTNNKMEIGAFLAGIDFFFQLSDKPLTVFTDSTYLVLGWNNVQTWENRNWKKQDKSSVLNIDLWKKALIHKNKPIELKWFSRELNWRADCLSKMGASGMNFLIKESCFFDI